MKEFIFSHDTTLREALNTLYNECGECGIGINPTGLVWKARRC